MDAGFTTRGTRVRFWAVGRVFFFTWPKIDHRHHQTKLALLQGVSAYTGLSKDTDASFIKQRVANSVKGKLHVNTKANDRCPCRTETDYLYGWHASTANAGKLNCIELTAVFFITVVVRAEGNDGRGKKVGKERIFNMSGAVKGYRLLTTVAAKGAYVL